MAVVIAALLPVFLLIVLGFILKRSLIQPETQWHGLERLTYYVLFPVLLVQTLVKADLSKVPVAGVGGALLLSVLADVAVVPRAAAPGSDVLRFDGPAFTSIFQGATRWQTYVALAVSDNLFGYAWAGAGLGRHGRDHPAGQRVQRLRAGLLRFVQEAVGPAPSP